MEPVKMALREVAKAMAVAASGGCNRMNVHDWLANLPFSDPESGCRIVEVSFNNGSRKDYFKNTTIHYFEKGDMIAVGRRQWF